MTLEYAPRSRKALGISLGVVIAIFLLPYIVEPIVEYFVGYDPSLEEHNLSRALDQELLKATLVLGSLNFVYAILGLGAILIGAKSIYSRRFPPAGMPVPFRIKVQNGKTAFGSGVVVCLLGCTFLFRAASFVVHWPWKLL
jgi:hypothetical protein